jgi:glycosyltransferase involved in cell wall biosynthesis
MQKPLFSIVIPVYNGEKFIYSALTQILQQEYEDFEVVVMNSCSTDRTTEIVTSFSNNNHKVRLITEKDNGIFDGMNRGIAYAKGDWLLFLGCDDILHDQHVLNNVSKYLEQTVDVVYGDVLWVPDMVLESGEVTPLQHVNRCINHQRIFYRRELFEIYGNYNCLYDVAADHALNVKFYCNPDIVWKYMPLVITKYYSGGNSSVKYDFAMWNDWESVFFNPFSKILPRSTIFVSLNGHYRELLKQGFMLDAIKIGWKIIKNVPQPGTIILILRQFFIVALPHYLMKFRIVNIK